MLFNELMIYVDFFLVFEIEQYVWLIDENDHEQLIWDYSSFRDDLLENHVCTVSVIYNMLKVIVIVIIIN